MATAMDIATGPVTATVTVKARHRISPPRESGLFCGCARPFNRRLGGSSWAMKVLIADDHALVREGLALIVRQWRADAAVIFAADAAGLLAAAEASAPDIALVDLAMPGMHGMEGLCTLRARCPALPVLVASALDDPATVRAALGAGASGFVAKNEPPLAIVLALARVVAGDIVVPPGVDAALSVEEPAPRRVALTARQLDVLGQLMHGRSNKAIAGALGLTEGTVKIHVAAVLRALRARNRTEAVLAARSLGIPPKA
jgi:DNA-binding NarL/FixJ family response regulator